MNKVINLDKRLKAALATVKEEKDILKPDHDKMQDIQTKAKVKLYEDDEAAAVLNNVESLSRQAKAFMIIAQAVDMLQNNKTVSGKELYMALAVQANVFPSG